MKYGIARKSPAGNITVLTIDNEFKSTLFHWTPKTYKTLKGAANTAKKYEGYVFDINEKGVMNY